jgi:biofilm PGA synthesis N-glycosyltransferase PgaC
MITWFPFLVGAGGVLYVLVLYPVYLGWHARRSSPIASRPFTPTVSVILPVRNGERWLRQKLDTILSLDYPSSLLQTIVVSDGSTDSSTAIAATYTGRGVVCIEIPHGGKALALNAGLAVATGEILFLTDIRQPLDPACLRHLTACFADPSVGVASGELIIRKGEDQEQESVGFYWKYEKWIRRRLSRIDSVMGATGAIYAMRRELAKPMPAGILLDDVYLPLLAFFAGKRVIFEERAIAHDYPTSLDAEFSRKVRTQAGVFQLLRHFPQLLGPSNRMWIHFVSHKLGRLALPYFLILAAVGTFFLPAPWYIPAAGAQILIYGLALLDPLLPDHAAVKRLASPARTFVVLMTAAFWAGSILFRPSGSFWKPPTKAMLSQKRRGRQGCLESS